jgi:hypothetical protein
MGDCMVHQALEVLVEQVRSLPGGGSELGLPRAAISTTSPPAVTARLPAAELRARTGAWLTALAARLEGSLPGAFARATQAWDQADTFVVLDAELRDEGIALRRAAEVLAADEDATLRTAGREASLGIDAVVGLVALLERRFAAILRLRLRSATPELVVDGRPFLDVAAALAEAGRRWR